MAGWLQLSVDVDDLHAGSLADLVQEAGALSVTLQDAGSELLIEPQPGTSPLWARVRVVALFPVDADLAALQQRIRNQYPQQPLRIEVEALADRDWTTAWRDDFRPMRFGARLWVCPKDTGCPQPDAVVVHLDPGVAFGTGTHATTALCLEWLDRHPPAGLAVIDYGCGSGILAIAASKLGAGPVYAVDIDPQAVAATLDNARSNGIEHGFSACLPEALQVPPVPLVIANILANPLCELAPRLSASLQPGGTILLTGILEHQVASVQAAYAPWLEFAGPVHRAEWVLLAGTRRIAD
jgi:ribosomal protein L11 methyltransferase